MDRFQRSPVLRPRLLPALLLASWPLIGTSAAPLETEEPAKTEMAIVEWLELGPAAAPLPVFHDQQGPNVEEVRVADLLASTLIDPFDPWPAAGDRLTWVGAGEVEWTQGDGKLQKRGSGPEVAYLAVYLSTDRFLEVDLQVSSAHLIRVYLDGEQIAEKTAADEKPEEPEKTSRRRKKKSTPPEAGPEVGQAEAEIALATGKHLLVVKAVRDPEGPAGWRVAAKLSLDEGKRDSLSAGLSPRHGLRIAELLDTPSIAGLDLSAEGDLVAVTLRKPSVPSDDRETWVEIRRVSDGTALRSYRGAQSIEDFTWAPAGRGYSHTSEGEKGGTLWIGDIDSGELRPLLRNIENLGEHRWSPDGSFLIYVVSVEEKDDDRGFKRMRSLPDRWTGWRTRDYLWQVSTADGSRRRLTAGPVSSELEDVSPDSTRILFSRSSYTRIRPFSYGQLYELDLATLEAEAVDEPMPWLGSASYSPDGGSILFSAGPSVKDGVDDEVPEGAIPNDYDSQLYVLDRAGGEVEAITRDFDPTVQQAIWSGVDGAIYVRAEDRDLAKIYRYRPGNEDKRFETLESGFEAVRAMALARAAGRLAFVASSSTAPPRVLSLDLEAGASPRSLPVPGEKTFELVDFGEVEDWSFISSEGGEIIGRIHYPPDFDAERKYPLLVYYYGGTAPTTRGFGGRYPKNYWTANGYVVYIMQPSGATGFGQEFSTRHVNDWGKRVSREIIEGVEKFAAAHDFIDAERLGCFGGSYGGFMTMLLISSTDLFAGAISHAGISSISSYWGEGWWGYLYSAQATAGSYPWNRPDIYVDQSPLFRADKINTPLLLLHGDADPNVPPGESEQMYTALRVLDKEVEYVKIAGEPHWILQYAHRKLWLETIMAWFDRTLKGQPEYWDHLYPDGVEDAK